MFTTDTAPPEPGLRHPHEQRCIDMQVQREVAGFRVGQRVAFAFGASGREFVGRIRAFSCVDGYQPAALVLLETPSRAWVHVERLSLLRDAPSEAEAFRAREEARRRAMGVPL